MIEIGDECGGWLATKGVTIKKSSAMVWVEAPARFRRSEVVELDSQECKQGKKTCKGKISLAVMTQGRRSSVHIVYKHNSLARRMTTTCYWSPIKIQVRYKLKKGSASLKWRTKSLCGCSRIELTKTRGSSCKKTKSQILRTVWLLYQRGQKFGILWEFQGWYADDTLIFCDTDNSQLKYLRVILILFEAISGLHINWGTSFIFPDNEVPWINILANILGGKVGNGGRTLFWEDKWVDQVTLRNRFPILCNMSLQTEATIREMRDNQGWDLRFRRHLNDWEVNKIVELLNILGQCKDLNTNEDNLFWNPDEQGRFSVGWAYRSSQRPGTHIGGWPWKMIWKRDCKVVADFHQLNGHQLDYAKEHQRSSSLLEQRWESVRTQGEMEDFPCLHWWSIWMERNQRCFKNKSCSMHNLKLNCLQYVEGELVECGNQMLTCKLVGITQDFTWYLECCLCDCDKVEKGALVGIGCCQRANCSRITGAMAEFSEWINDMELIDPPLLEDLSLAEGEIVIGEHPELIDIFFHISGKSCFCRLSNLSFLSWGLIIT
ncbi:hypothetical protein H5410_005398 [Solanum commersonii]|uniref:Uncharacterized protein n=1 Tax=Solanum commersonii TaxID=4109 RepID=A0A9J6A7G4_SOLCO|nr:hypothetical protein H5410_005398 [Solanum commersonii]